MANNYTTNEYTEQFTGGVNLPFAGHTRIIVIEPNPGYTIDIADFNIGGALSEAQALGSGGYAYRYTNGVGGVVMPPEIDYVQFAWHDYPTNSKLEAQVWLHAPASSTPTNFNNNALIEIDIDGVAVPTSTTGPFDVTLVSNVPDGYCTSSMWPMNQGASRNTNRCNGNFWETEEFSPPLTSHTTGSIFGNIREVWKVNNAPANTLMTIFSKVCFSSVGHHFSQPPSYAIQGYTNNYTVTETPNSLTLDAELTSDAGNSNIIPLDSVAGIIPGMMVTFSSGSGSLFSLASLGNDWPYVGTDIRVIKVNPQNSTIEVSEPQPNLLSGDFISFSTKNSNGDVLTKKFVFSFIADSNVQENASIITFTSLPVETPVGNIQGNSIGTSQTPTITSITI